MLRINYIEIEIILFLPPLPRFLQVIEGRRVVEVADCTNTRVSSLKPIFLEESRLTTVEVQTQKINWGKVEIICSARKIEL